MFSETFIQTLIIGALIWTGAGAVVLIVLLLIDYIKKSIW
jgi:hypothetical protein